jgi:hypothetical protein
MPSANSFGDNAAVLWMNRFSTDIHGMLFITHSPEKEHEQFDGRQDGWTYMQTALAYQPKLCSVHRLQQKAWRRPEISLHGSVDEEFDACGHVGNTA